MGNFCEGDYCVLSQFAPRWGSLEYGKPRIVKVRRTGDGRPAVLGMYVGHTVEEGREEPLRGGRGG